MALSGAWTGLWLIVTAVAAAPLTWRMVNRKPPRRIDAGTITKTSNYRDWLA